MTEKEFLISFIEHAEAIGKLSEYNNLTDEFIDRWLEYVHKEYFEVEFVKKDIEEIKQLYGQHARDNTEEENIRLSHMCQCEICDPQL